VTASQSSQDCLAAIDSDAAAFDDRGLIALHAGMDAVLRDNVLAFWLDRAIDREHGGYYMHFDEHGVRKRRNNKGIVTQARTAFLFARAARNDFGGTGLPARETLLEAAHHGIEFLRRRLWDHKRGGFFWLVERGARPVPRPEKHLYGQAFGLLALSEYAAASGESEALADADELVDLIEHHAHDDHHGGYAESFAEDWSRLPDGSDGVMGPAGLKSMNTHLHLMEAFTAHTQVSSSALGRARLDELVTILSERVMHQQAGVTTEWHNPDWSKAAPEEEVQVSYGHNVENVTLLAAACEALGRPPSSLLSVLQQSWEYCLRFGYNRSRGGMFQSGPLFGPADDLDMLWWVQAECLLSAIKMWSLTRQQRYGHVALQTWRLIDNEFVDRQSGEWRASITPGSPLSTDKAHNWKAGYHSGRALIESMKLLRG